MLADDDDALRSSLAAALRELGHDVIELADGGRLLVALAQAVRDGVPDAIVADVRMPVMSGLAMASAMREIDGRLPVVLMTAFPDEHVVRQAERLRVHLLEKPFDIDALEVLLTRSRPELTAGAA